MLDSTLLSRGSGSLMVGGRPYYIPPDHLLDPTRFNPSTDVYALALTLHSLLAGVPLQRAADHSLKVPGLIVVRKTQQPAPDQVRQLLEEFVAGHRDTHSMDDFFRFLSRVP